MLKNVRFEKGATPLEQDAVKQAIAAGEAALHAGSGGGGRVLIRASGTEPVIRVMAEGDDAGAVEAVVDAICAAVKATA